MMVMIGVSSLSAVCLPYQSFPLGISTLRRPASDFAISFENLQFGTCKKMMIEIRDMEILFCNLRQGDHKIIIRVSR